MYFLILVNILVTECVWNTFLAKSCFETPGFIGPQVPDIFSCCHYAGYGFMLVLLYSGSLSIFNDASIYIYNINIKIIKYIYIYLFIYVFACLFNDYLFICSFIFYLK